MKIDPSEYNNARAFQLDYGIYSFLRKYQGFAVDQARLESEALLNTENVEVKNSLTNRRLRFSVPEWGVNGLLSRAARKIQLILGDFSYEKVLPHCEWGNGATSSLKRRVASLDNKILERHLSVTRSCLKYARAYVENDLHWSMARVNASGPCCLLLDGEFVVREHGRYTTVEKTAAVRRPIEIQPTMNLFFQKGVGKYIRGRLQSYGVNLDDQSRNQHLAARAMIERLSTIDLANASDSVSRELVRLLLPDSWYNYLDDLRTKSFIDPGGKVHMLERFSAMGNGYTFELESLIFFALASAVRDEAGDSQAIVSVYGDDIIVQRCLADRLIHLLDVCGFEVNVDKTFIDGSFFESCGKHYFDCVDVTPLYQKEVISSTLSVYRASNRLLAWSLRLGQGTYYDSLVRGAMFLIVQGQVKLHRGPCFIEGDGFLRDPLYRIKSDIYGIFYIHEFMAVPKKREVMNHAALLATSLRRGVVVDSPFDGKLAIDGAVRVLLCKRRCLLIDHDVLGWATTL